VSAARDRDLAVAWRLAAGQWREQPARLLVTMLTLTCGVALFSAVWFVNDAALAEFDGAARRLAGTADVVVRGPRGGFPEALYAGLARRADVDRASPLVEMDVTLPAGRGTLRILGVDVFRAAELQPALGTELAGRLPDLFRPDAVLLSAAAARSLGVGRGGRFEVVAGGRRRSLVVLGLLSDQEWPQPLGIMDIASAQWTLDRLGVIDRVDLRAAEGAEVARFRDALAGALPPGVQAVPARIERGRAASATRAYRVNLNMLALVSLLAGATLLFATQALAILRRRRSLALLRALGVTRGGLRRALLIEGVLAGLLGSLSGVALGHALAAWLLAHAGGSLGLMQSASLAALRPQPVAWVAFVALGTLLAGLGAWWPAREAARRPPAQALKAGDAEAAGAALPSVRTGLAVMLAGALLAPLPPFGGVPVAGYCAIALLLFGALLLLPAMSAWLLRRLPACGHVPVDMALAQLRGSIGQITIGLAAVVTSFSLMVAMAIMVHSFRESFDRWLDRQLPADLELRAPRGSDTRLLTIEDQQHLRSAQGVAAVELRRETSLLLAPDRAPVTLIARDRTPTDRDTVLPFIERTALPAGAEAAWISEAMQDLFGWTTGATVRLPLAGRERQLFVAGVFRDYGRSTGVVVVPRGRFVAWTGDRAASDASVWLERGHAADAVIAALRGALANGDALEIRATGEVRALSMRSFDRAFAVTHLLEAAAVLIGLVGVALAAAATALARRAEFSMLRHLGLLRRQVIAMLGAEGLLVGALGAAFGLVLGAGLSLVLVYVVNRQSFHWSIDPYLPGWRLGALCAALIGAACLASVAGAQSALDVAVLRAVREDW